LSPPVISPKLVSRLPSSSRHRSSSFWERREAVVFQDRQIELEVVAELGQVGIGKKRAQVFLDQGQVQLVGHQVAIPVPVADGQVIGLLG